MPTATENWIPVGKWPPADNQRVDWITPSGDVVKGGRYCSRLWFLPPKHDCYCYYQPTYWRPAQ
jgi:hypothetical protein